MTPPGRAVTVQLVVAVVLLSPAGCRGARRWAGRSTRRRLGLGGPRSVPSGRPGRLEGWLAPRLIAADLAWPPGAVARWAGTVALGVAAAGAAARPVLAVLAPSVFAVGAVLALALAQGRREARLEAELPALLEAVARSLRSGASVPTALREAATTGSAAATDLERVLAEADTGLGLGEALDRWAQRRPRAAVRLAVGCLTVALVAGGSPARGVDGVAATLRERAEVDREGRALATQARTSAVVVTSAPVVFGALGVLGDDRTAGFLLGSSAGVACLVAGLTLDALGAWWMTRIARGPS